MAGSLAGKTDDDSVGLKVESLVGRRADNLGGMLVGPTAVMKEPKMVASMAWN